jgi:hypothetical protein
MVPAAKPRIGRLTLDKELDAVAIDCRAIVGSDLDVGNPSLDAATSTRFGAFLKSILRQRKDAEATFEKELAEAHLEEVLTPKRLGSAEGRRRSAADLARVKVAYTRLLDELTSMNATVQDWAQREMGVRPSDRLPLANGNGEIVRQIDVAIQESRAMLDFIGETHATYAPAQDQLLFATDAEVDQLNRNTRRIIAAWKKVEDLSARYEQSQRETLAENLRAMEKS